LTDQPKRKPRILIVDDYQTFADSLSLILNQNGCEAAAVYSGEEAIQAAPGLNPDVLISDVIMDGMTGIEAAILIGRTLPGCEIVLISGQHATADLLENARLQGHAFEVLPKPFHPQLLLDRLNGQAVPEEEWPG